MEVSMMSPPSANNQNQQENNEKLPKFSVEETGGACQNPALHQEGNTRKCKGILFKQDKLPTEFVQELMYTLYLMFGTVPEVDKQINIIRRKMKSLAPPGEELPFLGNSQDGNDNYIFTVPLCGQGYIKLIIKVDADSCSRRLDPSKIQVSIADIKKKSELCLQDGTYVHGMRLHDADLPSSLSFSLLCKKKSKMRTPTKFKVSILTMDEDGKEITSDDPNHTIELDFPACFYNRDADLQKDSKTGNYSLPSSSTDKKVLVLEDNHNKILQEIKDWRLFVQWFVTNGVLDKEFLKLLNDVLSEERKGEILRNLYGVSDIFPKFIEALRHSNNEELAEYLLQYIGMGNQNSSL